MFSKQKRILIFNDSMAMGGTERLLVNLLNYLTSKKCEVTLLLPVASDENILLSELAEGININYLYKPDDSRFARKWGEVKMIFRTKSFLSKRKINEADYDKLICFKEGFYAKMFSDWNIPKILWLHNILCRRVYETNSLKERFAVWLNKKEVAKTQGSYASYDKVISVSDACKQSYVDIIFDGNLPIQDIRIIPNAIDLGRVATLSKEYKPQNMPVGKTKFVLISRSSPEKRADRMVFAANQLKEEGYLDFIVHIIGTNAEETKTLQAEVSGSELDGHVKLHGLMENPYPYILQSDWLVCVSERESFSLAILEAMSLRVPIISTDCGGPGNILENGRYGIVVENSTIGVYEGLKSVLDHLELKEKYTEDLDKALAKYDYSNWLKAIDKLLAL